jgi:hypothetical protein
MGHDVILISFKALSPLLKTCATCFCFIIGDTTDGNGSEVTHYIKTPVDIPPIGRIGTTILAPNTDFNK